MKRSQSSKQMFSFFRASDTNSKTLFMKTGAFLFFATLLIGIVIWVTGFETFEGFFGSRTVLKEDPTSEVDRGKFELVQARSISTQTPDQSNNIAPASEIVSGGSNTTGQNLNGALVEVPDNLRSWAPLQEKSLRTAEEQAVFELQTLQKLDEALQFLKGQKPIPDQSNSDEFFRDEAKRIWNVTLVSEALKSMKLEEEHLQLIDTFLIECTMSNKSNSSGSERNNEEQMARKAEHLLDCVSVAHVYARSKPEQWSELEKRAPSGFEAIAKVANQYREIQ